MDLGRTGLSDFSLTFPRTLQEASLFQLDLNLEKLGAPLHPKNEACREKGRVAIWTETEP